MVDNSGVSISGTVTAGILVGGANAQAHVRDTTIGLETTNEIAGKIREANRLDLAKRYEALAHQVQKHAPEVNGGSEILAATHTVGRELAAPVPNRFTVSSLLDGISTGMKSIASVAAAVVAVKALIP